MKATILSATLALLVVCAAGGEARADHRHWRHLDDHAFDALTYARAARWEVHDHFTGSHDYEELLEDAIALQRALRDIEDAVAAERSTRSIQRLIDTAHDRLEHFLDHATASDYAFTAPASYIFETGGYRYRAPTRHVGYAHVQTLKRTLGRVDQTLHAMEEELDAIGHSHGHDHYRGGPGLQPQNAPLTSPAFPGQELAPPLPEFVPGAPSAAAAMTGRTRPNGEIRININ